MSRIARGTPMPSFHKSGGLTASGPALSAEQVEDIVAYLASLEKSPPGRLADRSQVTAAVTPRHLARPLGRQTRVQRRARSAAPSVHLTARSVSTAFVRLPARR